MEPQVLMIGPVTRSGGVAIHTRELSKALKKAGVHVVLYNSSFEGNYPKLIVNVIKIYKRSLGQFYFSITNRNAYNIIHVQASGGLPGFLNAITGVLVAKFLKKILIISFHHGDVVKFLNKYILIMKLVVQYANRFILVSDTQKETFIKFRLSIDNLTIVPNGFDSSIFKTLDTKYARKKLNIAENVPSLVNVANLEEIKGQKYLIESMKIILTARQDVMLYIIGQGPLKCELQSLIDMNGLQNNVLLIGVKSHDEIPLWMNACDVFVLPSLNEGNPTVMFESLGCGKPFVGTNVGGIPEIIINEKLGILVEPKDVVGLTNAILRALCTMWDDEYILNYAKQFTWDIITERTMEVYGEVLKER